MIIIIKKNFLSSKPGITTFGVTSRALDTYYFI